MDNDKNPSTSTDSPTESLNSKQEDSPTTSVSNAEDEIENGETTEAPQIKTSESSDDWLSFSFSSLSLRNIFSPSEKKYEASTPTKTPSALRAPTLSDTFFEDHFLYQEEETKEIEEIEEIEETTPFLLHPQEEIPENEATQASTWFSWLSSFTKTDISWGIFAVAASLPNALNAGYGISNKSSTTFNWHNLSAPVQMAFLLFFSCSLQVNTDQGSYFSREYWENLYENFSYKKLFSLLFIGGPGALPQMITSFEATATWGGKITGALFASLNGITYSASREAGVTNLYKKIKNFIHEKTDKSFAEECQSKRDAAKILKHLDKNQQNILFKAIAELLPSTLKELNKLPEDQADALLKTIHDVLDEHKIDWQLNAKETWLEKITDFSSWGLAAMALTSGIIFFQKALDAISLPAGEETIRHSGLFAQCMIGLIGTLSSPLYANSALHILETLIENFKTNRLLTVLLFLANVIASFSMKAVAESDFKNLHNFFGLKEGNALSDTLLSFLVLNGFITNLSSSFKKLNNGQHPTLFGIANWTTQQKTPVKSQVESTENNIDSEEIASLPLPQQGKRNFLTSFYDSFFNKSTSTVKNNIHSEEVAPVLEHVIVHSM